LNKTTRLIHQQSYIEKLKGEKFNIFSILKMESKENDTHSAFLCELLNIHGTHLKGNTFLELFVKTINNDGLDINSAEAKTEYPLGNIDDIEGTGGRIDIHIKDDFEYSIIIENKIYARDQVNQLVRYAKCNDGKNNVYYLTLFGTEPSNVSKKALELNKDYFIISYKEHIIKWLQLCIKEVPDVPFVRETLQQYLILIKKLTNTMGDNGNRELNNIILDHYDTAKYISDNFNNVRLEMPKVIRSGVLNQLKTKYSAKYDYKPNQASDFINMGLTLQSSEMSKIKLKFGIESFSGIGFKPKCLFIGILDDNDIKPKYSEHMNYKRYNNTGWYNIIDIKDSEGRTVNLSDPTTLKKLYNDDSFRISFIDNIVSKIENYIDKEYESIAEFLTKQSK
jgi:hypothetical protein